MKAASLEGTAAPLFALPDSAGAIHSLAQYKGMWVLVYFYPRDDTPGCTKEACSFQKNLSLFRKQGIVVLGISADSPQSHLNFSRKYHLGFTLLSDEKKKVITQYKCWGKKQYMGKEYYGIFRTTFLINPEGIIVKVYGKVKPEDHASEILADFSSFSGRF